MIDQNKIYEFSGNHYKMGYQQGKSFQSEIQRALKTFKSLEEIKSLKPSRLIPNSLFIKLAAKKAIEWLRPIISK